MKIHIEKMKSDFEGTIIDLETIGSFNREFYDSRIYAGIRPVIFGYIDKKGLQIHCAKSKKSITKLNKKMDEMLEGLERPFYAFNSSFERGVLFHTLGKEIEFEKELNLRKFERKASAVANLGIEQYGDPFNDVGKLCMEAWEAGKLKDAMAHNRSCLLKERDILLKRGHREPDTLWFKEMK